MKKLFLALMAVAAISLTSCKNEQPVVMYQYYPEVRTCDVAAGGALYSDTIKVDERIVQQLLENRGVNFDFVYYTGFSKKECDNKAKMYFTMQLKDVDNAGLAKALQDSLIITDYDFEIGLLRNDQPNLNTQVQVAQISVKNGIWFQN